MTTASRVSDLVSQPYRYGFVTDIETEKIAKGLSEDVVRLIWLKRTNRHSCWIFGCGPGGSGKRCKSLTGRL